MDLGVGEERSAQKLGQERRRREGREEVEPVMLFLSP